MVIKKKSVQLHDEKMKEDEKMFKRLLISIMCVGFTTLLVAEVNAASPGAGGLIFGWGSVDCYSIWHGLGNTGNNPVLIDCTILPVTIGAQCMNPAGMIGGGVVFDLDGQTVAGEEVVYPYQLEVNGSYESDITIGEPEIYDGMDLGSSGVCDAFNQGTSVWSVAPPPEGYINVWRMFAAVRGWVDSDGVDTDGDGNLEFDLRVEDVQLACKVDDPSVFDEQESGDYRCDELCDKTKKVDCPASLTSYLCDPNDPVCPDYFDF